MLALNQEKIANNQEIRSVARKCLITSATFCVDSCCPLRMLSIGDKQPVYICSHIASVVYPNLVKEYIDIVEDAFRSVGIPPTMDHYLSVLNQMRTSPCQDHEPLLQHANKNRT